MKQMEITRAVKEELWKLFSASPHDEVKTVIIDGREIPAEAVAKQYALWAAHTNRKARNKELYAKMDTR